ncbi:MAG: acylphosphatase [Anaerohalosphaeraceae bacterium]
MEPIAEHVIFSGRVQGVGFRYTTRRIAERYNLTGWVRNLPDGTVEAVFQGSPEAVQGCLNEISEHFVGYLRDKQISPMVYNPNWKDFRITY